LEAGRRGSGAVRQLGQAGLDPALTLDHVAAGVADVHVLPRPLLLGRAQVPVEERADPAAEVPDHEPLVSTCADSEAGPAYRSRPSPGARWASALRSIVRPRWMRERTVPSLASMISAISS